MPFRIKWILIFMLLTGCKDSVKKTTSHQEFTQQEARCIKRVLAEDDSLGSIRNEAGRNMPVSKSILQYTKTLKALNFQECPPRFKEAFEQHRVAWEEMLQVTDKYSSVRGELHEVFDSIAVSKDSAEFKTRLDKIWSTWESVEKRSAP